MKLKLLYYIIFGAVGGVFVALMNLPPYTIAVFFGMGMIISLANLFYIIMYSQNLKKLEKYIKQNSKNPIYKSLQLLAQGTDEEFMNSLEAIVKKYKNTKYEATYGALLAMMQGNFEQAHRYNKPQLHKEVGKYTHYLIEIMAGKEIEDVPVFKQSWMNASLEAHRAFVRKDLMTFEILSKQATNQAKGIQYYGNYYTFKRMRERLSE